MRICFMGDGESIHIRRWLGYFKERGHEVHLISFSQTHFDGIVIHVVGDVKININGGNWRYILHAREIKKIIKEIKPDIISAHFITSYGFLASLTGFKNIAMTAWGTDILVTPKINLIYKLITKFALSRARLITSDSEYMTREINKLTNTRAITVPMGVEEDLCRLERMDNDDSITVLSLRTINRNSNIDIILKAYNELKKIYNKPMKLIITNEGPEKDNIISLIHELGIEDSVELAGFISREKLINLLQTSNVYVTIPSSDATSVTLLEAMACGCVVITSDLPANREWINDGVSGLIMKSFNKDELVELLCRAIDDSSLRESCNRTGREVILERAIWNSNMEMVEKEYLAVINR